VNNKIYLTIKVPLSITNYSRETKIEANIRRKKKMKKLTKFTERIKKKLK